MAMNTNAEDTEGRSLVSCNRVRSSITLHLALEAWSHRTLEFRKLLEPTSLRVSVLGLQEREAIPGFSCGCWRLEFGSSCLQGKPFHPFRVISPDPPSILDN